MHRATYHQGEVSGYIIEAMFEDPCPFLSKTTKMNLLINRRNEHCFISKARFATTHLILQFRELELVATGFYEEL